MSQWLNNAQNGTMTRKLLYNNDIGCSNFDFRNHVESYNIKMKLFIVIT